MQAILRNALAALPLPYTWLLQLAAPALHPNLVSYEISYSCGVAGRVAGRY
jgi:predicted double-glycine peptidase